jgi:hypothetical protein
MRCRKVQEYISRSIDGELSGTASARLERHLAACDECRAVREDLRKIVAGAARLETPAPSGGVWLAVKAGLVRETAGRADEGSGAFRRPAFGLGLPALRSAGVAAAALVLVVTGIAGSRLGARRPPRTRSPRNTPGQARQASLRSIGIKGRWPSPRRERPRIAPLRGLGAGGPTGGRPRPGIIAGRLRRRSPARFRPDLREGPDAAGGQSLVTAKEEV